MTMVHKHACVISLDTGKQVLLYGGEPESPKRLEITDYSAMGARHGPPPVVCVWGDDLTELARLLAREVL